MAVFGCHPGRHLIGGKLPMLIDKVETKSNAAGRSLTLFLSLFLLLLAFFIVLNAMSRFEKGRGAAVVDSVSQAFMPASMPTLLSGSAVSDPIEGADSQRLVAIGSAFETILPGAASILYQTQDRLVLRLSADVLFDNTDRQLAERSRKLISRLLPLLRAEGDKAAIEMAIITGMLDGEKPIVVGLRSRQAASLLASFRAAGLRGRDLTIGAEIADSDQFTFIFDVAARRDDV
jgi:hypothetical protein